MCTVLSGKAVRIVNFLSIHFNSRLLSTQIGIANGELDPKAFNPAKISRCKTWFQFTINTNRDLTIQAINVSNKLKVSTLRRFRGGSLSLPCGIIDKDTDHSRYKSETILQFQDGSRQLRQPHMKNLSPTLSIPIEHYIPSHQSVGY